MKALLILSEGIRFLYSIRNADPSYLSWRLGTVYGSFDRKTGEARPLRDLLRDCWKDREQVKNFLSWRRAMRLNAKAASARQSARRSS